MGKVLGIIITFVFVIALVPDQITAYFATNTTGWSLPVIGVWSIIIVVFIIAIASVIMGEI